MTELTSQEATIDKFLGVFKEFLIVFLFAHSVELLDKKFGKNVALFYDTKMIELIILKFSFQI